MMESPVTVMADVAVNSASQSPTLLLEHSGVASSSVPRNTTSKPVTTVNCGTVRRRRHRWLRSMAFRMGKGYASVRPVLVRISRNAKGSAQGSMRS